MQINDFIAHKDVMLKRFGQITKTHNFFFIVNIKDNHKGFLKFISKHYIFDSVLELENQTLLFWNYSTFLWSTTDLISYLHYKTINCQSLINYLLTGNYKTSILNQEELENKGPINCLCT